MIKKCKLAQQSGFTLVELIIVIGLLAILAATALPNFVNVTDDANKASTESIAGALNSANKINSATKRGLKKGTPIETDSNCEDAANALLDGGVPDGYEITPTSDFGGDAFDKHICTIENESSGDTATFTITTTED